MSFDLVRQRTTTMGLGPYVLTVDAGFQTLASRYATGVTVFVGLQGLDVAGAPVAQRMVGTGQLLADGRLQIDTTTTPASAVSFACDSIVVVAAQSVAAVQAMVNAIVNVHAALTSGVHGITAAGAALTTAADAAAQRAVLALGGAALLNVGVTAGTVAAGDDSRLVDNEKTTNKNVTSGYFGRGADDAITLPQASPTMPASGLLKAFSRNISGRQMLAMIGPSGLDTALQPFLARNKIGWWSPLGNGAVVSAFGLVVPTALGAATSRGVSTSSILNSVRRIGYASTAVAGTLGGFRQTTAQIFRGLTDRGGFHVVLRFAVSDAALVTGARTFVGMQQAVTAPTNVQPSSLLNIIGVGEDDGDENWHVMHNDGAGTAPRIDTGIAINVTSLLELAIFSPPDASFLTIQFTDLSAGVSFSTSPTTDLPATNTLLTANNSYRSNNLTASIVALDLAGLYVETDV